MKLMIELGVTLLLHVKKVLILNQKLWKSEDKKTSTT